MLNILRDARLPKLVGKDAAVSFGHLSITRHFSEMKTCKEDREESSGQLRICNSTSLRSACTGSAVMLGRSVISNEDREGKAWRNKQKLWSVMSD